jgi:glycosyltransferase involved in cell wall biosynthesis
MKILYDYQMFSIQKFGGITRYFSEMIKHLPPEHQYNLALIFSDNHHLKENKDVFKKINILPDRNFKGKYFIQEKLSSINYYYSRYCISKNNFDLFHPTFYDNYFLPILKKPYIITVHDLILFKFNDPFYTSHPRKLQMENAIKKANRVISISANTKKDIIETFNIDPGKIDVIYHGYNKPASNKRLNNYGRYILFVGQRSHHKNFTIFVIAISKLLNREKDIHLICVGKPFDPGETGLLTELKITNQTMAISVDDKSLNDLYAGALVFVYPSLYEGFGMPILEAFANNCPVCLSNASCFPEIAGNAGVYFDPYDPESISNAVEKVIYDTNFAREIVQAGKNKLPDFSWEKAGEETSSSYKKTV